MAFNIYNIYDIYIYIYIYPLSETIVKLSYNTKFVVNNDLISSALKWLYYIKVCISVSMQWSTVASYQLMYGQESPLSQ